MRLPVDEPALKGRLQALERTRGSEEHARHLREPQRDAMRRQPSSVEDVQAVEEFGRELFEALLPSEVRSCYRSILARAREQGKGLRLRLRIESPELAALPWEFLYDEAEGDHVCLSRETPFIRYLELGRPPQASHLACNRSP